MLTNPCVKTCPDRNGECHGVCPEYLAYEKEKALEREIRHKELEYRQYKGDESDKYYRSVRGKRKF